jgi:hypothetical protein
MDTEARDLKAAVERSDFAAIPRLATAYRKRVSAALAQAADPARRCAILQSARETLNFSLQLVRVQRAHLASRLKPLASAYSEPPTATYTWHIEG